ncbi:MAG: radical SAM protein [Candidatus Moraniibacteriota bacterium]
MEYSIYITYNCNLRCSFCYVKEKLSQKRKDIPDKKIDQIVKYIADNEKKGDWVVFFGGEPLLVPQVIDKFIKKLRNTQIRFAMYTNGLLLNKIPKAILEKISVIFVSADGDKKTQEKHRGAGSYHRIIKNIDFTRKKTDAQFIGRMTIDEETNLYESAVNLLKHTDFVHWQIANKPIFRNPDIFVKSYKTGLEKLFNFWMDNFKKGKNLNIIPFQAIIASLVFNYPKNKDSFRCGIGRSVQVIDTNGKIYWCDELVGNKKALIGDVTNKRVKNTYKAHYKIFDDCKTCEVSEICRGRCRKCLEAYAPEHNRVYCELTKILVTTIEQKLGEIKKIIKNQGLTLDKFYKIRHLTEEIP